MLPIPLIVAGALAVLGLIGLAVGFNAKSSHIEVQPDKPISKTRKIFLVIGTGLLLAGIIWGIIIGIKASDTQSVVVNHALNVHLVNISYMTEGWRPVFIDLRTSNTEGVTLHPGELLRLFDIRVSSPENLDGVYNVQVEAYANDNDFMGKTAMAKLSPNITNLGEIIPENFKHPTDATNWQVPSEWKEIVLYIVLYDENSKDVVGKAKNTIKLIQSESNSWWVSPPYVKIASVVYQINDGEKISMDFRTLESDGINVNLGDTLYIREIWYHSLESDKNKQIVALAYLKPDPSDKFPDHSTPLANISAGVHDLIQDESFTWNFETTTDEIVIALYRNDGFERYTRLDEYVVPIKPGSTNGLIPLPAP
jgi:hypothetical protein